MRFRGVILWVLLAFGSLAWRVSLWQQPTHFPSPEIHVSEINWNKDLVNLGRQLFYDPILSKNGSISCASCHSPYHAFAHVDHSLSHGIFDSILDRNAPALFNLAWGKSFMWDGAIHRLDAQPLAPISDAREMGSSMKEVVRRLNLSPYKNWVIRKNLGDSFSSQLVLDALLQFQLRLVSAGSRFDSMKLGKLTFTSQENSGYQLFLKHCNGCHTEPIFTHGGFERNGLSLGYKRNGSKDLGRMLITGLVADSLKFKVPSLRNLRYTEPYMHDGRFASLQPVLKHYQSKFEFSDREKQDLIAFLIALNDTHFVQEEAFHFPKTLLKYWQ